MVVDDPIKFVGFSLKARDGGVDPEKWIRAGVRKAV
jgi:hypothetical protein